MVQMVQISRKFSSRSSSNCKLWKSDRFAPGFVILDGANLNSDNKKAQRPFFVIYVKHADPTLIRGPKVSFIRVIKSIYLLCSWKTYNWWWKSCHLMSRLTGRRKAYELKFKILTSYFCAKMFLRPSNFGLLFKSLARFSKTLLRP